MKRLAVRTAATLLTGIPVMTTHAQKPEGHYANVNGLRMYYELHGPETSRPLVLLHGAFSNIDSDFGKMLPTLANTRRVIAVELQAHGRTADVDRRLTYEAMADDVAALLGQMRVTNADFLGYSMGGAVGVQVAIRHPALARRVVFFGGPAYSPDGVVPELLAFEKTMTAEQMSGTPWHQAYLKIAPRPQDFPKLVERIKELDLNWRGFLAGGDSRHPVSGDADRRRRRRHAPRARGRVPEAVGRRRGG
jgi:pimeloyl-ACP methyl ester carboxylesterase